VRDLTLERYDEVVQDPKFKVQALGSAQHNGRTTDAADAARTMEHDLE